MLLWFVECIKSLLHLLLKKKKYNIQISIRNSREENTIIIAKKLAQCLLYKPVILVA